jgi:pimeloyl-ACP methyl ester carboxylesterase
MLVPNAAGTPEPARRWNMRPISSAEYGMSLSSHHVSSASSALHDKRHTLSAARELPRFTKPVLLAWATEDRLFRTESARRLAATLPNATLTQVDDSYTFIPEDQPAQLTRLIAEFSRAEVAA